MIAKENNRGFRHFGRPLPGLHLPKFKAGLKWRGADLQTLRNTIVGPAFPLTAEYERVSFDIGGGKSLKAAYHRSPEYETKPVVIVIHGLAGDETSPNVISTSAYFSSLGYPVLRLNLRGAGPSAESSVGPYHGGLSEDLTKVIEQVSERGYGAGNVLYGISLGGNMMMKYLGEQGRYAPVKAAIGVSAPLSLKSVQQKIMAARNKMYHNYLLVGMKKYVRQMAEHHPSELIERSEKAKSLLEFDDQFTAPSHGMSGAEEYYQKHSAREFVHQIKVPTLLIHAQNDPWIPVEDYHSQPWSSEGAISLLITDDGGHVGFHDKGQKMPWQDHVGSLFLDHIMSPKMEGDNE